MQCRVSYLFIFTVLIGLKKRQAQSQKNNNKENIAVNVIDSTCIEDQEIQTKKRKREPVKSRAVKTPMKEIKTEKEREKMPSHKVRYDETINHMPGANYNKRVRCKLEGCPLSSSFYCVRCKVHLCIKSDKENTQEKNCFLKFHSLN